MHSPIARVAARTAGPVLVVYALTVLAAGLAVSAWAQLSLDGALDGALDGIVWFALVSVFCMAAMAKLQTGYVPRKERAAAILRLQQVAGCGNFPDFKS